MYKNILDCVAYTATTQVHKAAVIFVLALLGLGFGVGFSITSTNARNAADADNARRSAIFGQFQMLFTTRITEGAALAKSLGGFMLGDSQTTYTNTSNMTFPVFNASAPAMSRRRYFNDDAYQRLGGNILSEGVTSLVLAPMGVITHVHPVGASTMFLDMFTLTIYSDIYSKMRRTGKVATSGPNKYASRPGYGIIVWYPVFVNNTVSENTFYGFAFASMEMGKLLSSMNTTDLKTVHKLDYVLWFTAPESPQPTIIDESDRTVRDLVMREGMRMSLPVVQEGRNSYFAMYPEGGPVSATISSKDAGIVVGIVMLEVAVCVALLYAAVFAAFMFRHRRAPANGTQMYVAAVTLRGAQPIAERAPLEAVRMFTEFTARVRQMAVAHGCYPVCEIGDRTMYVVARSPAALVALAKQAVVEINVRAAANAPSVCEGKSSPAPIDGQSSASEGHLSNTSRSRSRSYSMRNEKSRARTQSSFSRSRAHEATRDQESSFIGTAVCRPSAALHVIGAAHGMFDAARDVYFYGNAAQLGRLCAAVDGTKGGEIGWTRGFEEECGGSHCRTIEEAAVSCHIVSEGGDTTTMLHVAAMWKETGDERDNEDPSVSMASLGDVYLKRMTAIVSEGRSAMREKRTKGDDKNAAKGSETGSSEKSADATSVTRNATLLHIAFLGDCDGRMPLDVVRRIVADEKGAVISAHDNGIVAAFNLLSAGGHHQVRAADTVMRLRDVLSSVPFVCSIHHGKVTALIADGLVMCSGDVAAKGRQLLERAVLAAAEADAHMRPHEDMASAGFNGLCLLFAQSELSSSYECEAVDVVGVPGSVVLATESKKLAASHAAMRPIVYRLSHRKVSSGKGGKDDDEWMYQLKDEEEQSPYASVNAVFTRIAEGQRAEALAMWEARNVSASARRNTGGVDGEVILLGVEEETRRAAQPSESSELMTGSARLGLQASIYARTAIGRLVQ